MPQKDLISKPACVRCLQTFLADKALLSPSTAVILESTVHYLEGSSASEHVTNAAKIIGDTLCTEVKLSDGAKKYISDKIVQALKEADIL
jgi:hypothetical protein